MKKLICYTLLFLLFLQNASIPLDSLQNDHPTPFCELERKKN